MTEFDAPNGSINLAAPDAYGRAFATVYDRWYEGVTDAEATAAFVAERCGAGPVLELGVGSGRLAGPMTAIGLPVIGVDASAVMLQQCPPGAAAHLIQADMRSLPLQPGTRFGAVLIAFNTLFNVVSAEGQQRVLAEAARVLAADGAIIVEALDATLLGDAPAISTGVSRREPAGLVVSTTKIEPGVQLLGGRHYAIDDRGVSVYPWQLRWLTPAQIDQMAANAGLALGEAHREGESRIAVYRRST